MTINKSQIAASFGVSTPTVGNWIVKGCPVEKKGDRTTEWKLSKKAVSDWLRHNGKADKKTVDAAYSEARLEKIKAESEIARMNADQLAETLVPIEDVAMVVEQEYTIIRAHFRGMSNALPALLVNKTEEQIAEIIAKKVDSILDELSEPDNILEKEAPGSTENLPQDTNETTTI